MVEDFAVIRPFADFHATHSIGANRMSFLDPIHDVEVMNVLLDNVIAAGPDEVIPIPHLVLHLAQLASGSAFQIGARFDPRRGAVPITTHRNNITYLAIVKPI